MVDNAPLRDDMSQSKQMTYYKVPTQSRDKPDQFSRKGCVLIQGDHWLCEFSRLLSRFLD